MPRVGLNAHLLSQSASYRSAGVSRYIRRLLDHLPQVDAATSYIALVGDPEVCPAGWERSVSRWRTQSPPLRILWEQTAQPWRCRQEGLNLLHAPVYVGPVVRACPTVVTVHDLSFYLYPRLFRPFNRAYLQALTRHTVEHAAGIIAVSASTRDDLVRILGVPSERITVIPNGVDETMRPVDSPAALDDLRRRYGLPERMILFLGTLEPRKNIVTLLEAYALLQQRYSVEHRLVIAGGKGWYYDEIDATIERLGLHGRIISPGFVPQDELALWYSAADLFVYPALYEGFGLPPLEAMACGTPVIVSSTSSLPEVVGDAGLMVDPHDPAALAEAMASVLDDASRAAEMRAAGLARAAGFSWQATASATATLYHKILGDCTSK
ncbi:MAG: glycosyltransferase family 4 protein [Anaerolineae bacterium]|jgi:glycosyltransferase involved in cell wall biosynthesis